MKGCLVARVTTCLILESSKRYVYCFIDDLKISMDKIKLSINLLTQFLYLRIYVEQLELLALA